MKVILLLQRAWSKWNQPLKLIRILTMIISKWWVFSSSSLIIYCIIKNKIIKLLKAPFKCSYMEMGKRIPKIEINKSENKKAICDFLHSCFFVLSPMFTVTKFLYHKILLKGRGKRLKCKFLKLYSVERKVYQTIH